MDIKYLLFCQITDWYFSDSYVENQYILFDSIEDLDKFILEQKDDKDFEVLSIMEILDYKIIN